jgi:CPA2 family monovalent cation:H+ antiporter-2
LSEVLPFRSLFNAIFFVSVGMLMDISFFLEQPLWLLGGVVGVLVVKAVVTTISALALGYPIRIAAGVGLTLAQIGEFSFVLERTGRAVGLSPMGLGPAGEQVFIVTAVLLMLGTPALLGVGPRLGEWLQGTVGGRLFAGTNGEAEGGEEAELEDHVVIVGFGPAGRRLAQVLDEDDLPFVVVELNPKSVEEAREMGYHAIYGDATRAPLLEEAGIHHAKLAVVAINDQDAAFRITSVARYENPTLQLIVRTRFLSDIERFRSAGADVVVPEEIETSVQIFAHVLRAYRVGTDEIEKQIRTIRAHDYELLRGDAEGAHLLLQGLDDDGVHTRTVTVREACPAAQCTLGDLRLQQEYSLSVLAVRRDDDTISAPDGTFTLQPGDRLVVMGSAEAFAEGADLFRVSESAADGETAA